MRPFCTAIALTALLPETSLAQEPRLNADKLFDPAHLVEVQIELPEADWDALRSQTRAIADSLGKTPSKSPFRYYNGNVTIDSVRIENVGIRKKGFIGSLDNTRPSLKVKFDEFVEQSPAAGFDRLTLNNNKQDKSQLSQYLSYKMFDQAGVPGSRCNFAKVTVNGTPLGIYSNVESIKRPFLQREFGDGSGYLYEGTVADLFLDWLQKYELKTTETKLDPLKRVAAVLEKEELDLEALGEHLDVDAFLGFWATESLIGFWDGYTNNQNNYFIYRLPANGKLYFIPWGTDSSFTATMPLPPYIIKRKSVHSQSLLANRLYQLPAVQKKYRTTLEALLERVWNEDELLADVDRVEALVKDHLHEKQKDFFKAVKKVRSFIKSRRRVLKRELRKWPVKFKEGPRRPIYFEPFGVATASFSTKFHKDSPKDPLANGEAKLDLLLEGKRVSFKQIGVSAELSKWPTPDGSPQPPTIVFTGTRESDGKQFVLGMSPALEDFRPTKGKSVTVQGVLIEGKLGWLNPKAYKMASGQAKFELAEMKAGAVVRGEMEVKIVEMSGGETNRFRPK